MIILARIALHEQKRGPMREVSRAHAVKNFGLYGDIRAKVGSDRQVVVVSRESWEAACSKLRRTAVDWTVRRGNLLVTGKTFGPEDVGKHLCIGSVVLLVAGECKPCPRMDEQVPGLTAALTPDWRAGVTCRVLAGGELSVPSQVILLDQP